MDEMKYDMCGSTVVLGVMQAMAMLKPKLNVVGIIPSTENLSGAKAYKLEICLRPIMAPLRC